MGRLPPRGLASPFHTDLVSSNREGSGDEHGDPESAGLPPLAWSGTAQKSLPGHQQMHYLLLRFFL